MKGKFAPVRLRSKLTLLFVISFGSLVVQAQTISVDPARMSRVGTVDPRFFSYNIEMAEVTGGNFWKPYRVRTPRQRE